MQDLKQCRSCLSTKATEYIDYYSFNLCTQLQAKDDDNLPGMICTSCSQDLQVAYHFVRMARQSDAALRDNLASRAKSDSGASSSTKEQEDEMEMEHLELLEEVEVNEEDDEEEEECVVEELLDDEEVIEQIEVMEVEAVEEHILEEVSMEANVEFVEEKSQVQDLLTELAQRTLMQHQPNMKQVKELQSTPDFYADDELDQRYLIEYHEQEDATDELLKLPPSAEKWKCFECKRVLRGDVSFEGHMNMHKNVRPYKCTHCECAFRCRYTLKSHFSIRHQTKSLDHDQHDEHPIPDNCSMCSKIFVSAAETEEHMQLVHSNTTEVQCPHCEHLAPMLRMKLGEHFRNKHPVEYRKHFPVAGRPSAEPGKTTPWQCKICKRYFRSESLLSDHCNIHLNERPYDCQYCSKRFATAVNIRQHMRLVHPEYYEKISESQTAADAGAAAAMMAQCELCKKQLLSKNFEKHMALHEKKEREASEAPTKFLCAYCSRECKTQKTLNQHEKMHVGESPDVVYICADCGRQYATQHLLNQHIKQAHKERDHICPICGNAFKLKNQLVNHMKLHLEKNIQCTLCDKKYARQFDLNVHMRSHTGEQPFACHLCEKRFAIKVRLTYHLQKHYGVKHQCKVCGADFNSKQKLKLHLYKHTGMPYRCETCDNHGFANRDVFKRHLSRVHNTKMSEDALVEMFQQNTGKSIRIIPIIPIKMEIIAPSEGEGEVNEDLISADDIAMEIVPA